MATVLLVVLVVAVADLVLTARTWKRVKAGDGGFSVPYWKRKGRVMEREEKEAGQARRDVLTDSQAQDLASMLGLEPDEVRQIAALAQKVQGDEP